MGILVLAEMQGDDLVVDYTARAVAAGRMLGTVSVLVAGANASEAAAQAAEIEGVEAVLLAQSPELAHGLAESLAELLVSLSPRFTHILAASTMAAKNVLPRVAALLDVMIVPDVVSILDEATFERPIYAGNALQTIRSSDPLKILTVRASSFKPSGMEGAAAIEAIAVPAGLGLSTWLEDMTSVSGRPELGSAKIVVAGGRGIGSAENFALLSALADKLGAALGASRAAVDAGYAPNDWQVGQTGKIVAPELYLAVGVSGAIQHLAGMKESRIIVAVNKDPEAPIFEVADYGLVGDFSEIIPEIILKL